MQVLFIPGYFGDLYQLLSAGQQPFPDGEPITTGDAALLFSLITRHIDFPANRWRGALIHLGISIPPNFSHDYDIYQEVIKLFQRGLLRLIRIPRLDRWPAVSTGDGWGYCFLRARHPSHCHSPVAVRNRAEAQELLGRFKSNEDKLRVSLAHCFHGNMPQAGEGFLADVAESLANKSLFAYKVPVVRAAPIAKPVEYVPATAADRPVPLAPESEPAPVAPAAKPASTAENPVIAKPAESKPAQTLEECEQRLAAARERLQTDGYQSKYTDEQLRNMAQKGELDDRFVVRFIESKYAGDSGYLGQMKDGNVKYWSTTFNQMENADTDPKTLCGLIGIEYKPDKIYTLVVVDTQAKGAGQSATIVPTYSQLRNFAKSEIKGISPDAVDKVMTPEFSDVYAEHMVGFKKRGLNIDKEKDISRYADANFSDKEDRSRFKTRIKIHEKLGANDHYTGDGTTKNLIKGCPNKCGVMETFTYDKSPQTLGQLEASGSAKRIATAPLKGEHHATF